MLKKRKFVDESGLQWATWLLPKFEEWLQKTQKLLVVYSRPN